MFWLNARIWRARRPLPPNDQTRPSDGPRPFRRLPKVAIQSNARLPHFRLLTTAPPFRAMNTGCGGPTRRAGEQTRCRRTGGARGPDRSLCSRLSSSCASRNRSALSAHSSARSIHFFSDERARGGHGGGGARVAHRRAPGQPYPEGSDADWQNDPQKSGLGVRALGRSPPHIM